MNNRHSVWGGGVPSPNYHRGKHWKTGKNKPGNDTVVSRKAVTIHETQNLNQDPQHEKRPQLVRKWAINKATTS